MTHSRDNKRIHVLFPENKNEKIHEGMKTLKQDALNTTKTKKVKL